MTMLRRGKKGLGPSKGSEVMEMLVRQKIGKLFMNGRTCSFLLVSSSYSPMDHFITMDALMDYCYRKETSYRSCLLMVRMI